MEVDSSPPPRGASNLSPRNQILQKLEQLGIPEENLEQLHPGIVSYAKNNKPEIAELVSAILPSDEEAMMAIMETDSEKVASSPSLADLFQESMVWLQWLMFEGEPNSSLEHLAGMSVGQRGVCGAVWGINDIAYRCRTCEHDPTCAICVPCFQNGNHKEHDYSIIYTGGGCCDCGDVTAWKREGFCSKHKGAEQIQPLPNEFANSLGPVLDSLLQCWRQKLLFAESTLEKSPRVDNHVELKKVVDELTSTLVAMLLEFCKCSESLLSFISRRVFASVGLLDVLVRGERFMDPHVVKNLHELLLKLLGEPQFKYEFAKVFLSYYPTVINEALKDPGDGVFKKYPLLSTFSVQIFTVPTLTPRLVKEMNLLAMLLECLGHIFISCAGEDGQLQVTKWGDLYETTVRVVEDIRFVLSHSVVPQYLTSDRRDILATWMRLLSYVQGMNSQKRETGMHIEEENENIHLPFVLDDIIANIHSLIVGGAFSVSDTETDAETLFDTNRLVFEDQDSQRLAKVGRLSQESSVSSMPGRSSSDRAPKAYEARHDNLQYSSSVLWLVFECLRAIENWLRVDNTIGLFFNVLSPKTSSSSGNNRFAWRKTLLWFKTGGLGRESGPVVSDESVVEAENLTELEALRVLSLSDWPRLVYSVSSQHISVHIPLHRLLSMVLRRALEKHYHETGTVINASLTDSSSAAYSDFFGHILGGCHPYGFSAFLMEHPLRIRVFCAEVHAGMWRRNGDSAILSCEWYRSVRWSEQGLELDLFLLQCCAALAPADLFVERILERFELSSFLSFNLERSSEYEPVLVQEMLTLIIHLVKERRFCGLSASECLERELVYKLSIGDATRSQLVKSLPRGLSKIDTVQETLDRIATYSHPSGINQGMYKLRMGYWKELDLYHPRRNSRDLQVAEERYLHFCKVSPLTTQLPRWTKIFPPLSGVARLATCKTSLQIIRAVLFYAVFSDKSTTSRAPDGVLVVALHLLSLALDICHVQRGSGDRSCPVGDVIPLLALADEEICMNNFGNHSMLSLLVLLMRKHEKENASNFIEPGNFNLSSLIENLLKKFAELEPQYTAKLQNLAPEVVNHLSPSTQNDDTGGAVSASDNDKRKAKARERQAAILEKMRAQQSKFLASIDSNADDEIDCSKQGKEACGPNVGHIPENQVTCSLCHDPNSKRPLSFLVLLQKSRLLSFVDRGPASWEQVHCLGKNPASTSPNMINISSRKKNKVSSSQLSNMVQIAVNELAAELQPAELNGFLEFVRNQFRSLPSIVLPGPPCYSREKTVCSLEKLEEHLHLLIQEQMHDNLVHSDSVRSDEKMESAGGNPESLLLGKYIAALPNDRSDSPSASDRKAKSDSRVLGPAYDGFGPSDCDGIHLSSCGHAVHQECLDRYLSSLKERHRRILFEGRHTEDPDQGEFLCPVCRGLANSTLPTSPEDCKRTTPDAGFLTSSYTQVDLIRIREALSLLQAAADVAGKSELLKILPGQRSGRMRLNLDSVLRVLSGMYFPGKDKFLGSGRVSHPLILWDTLNYSLLSTEIAARSEKSSFAPNYSLSALYKELRTSSGFILSLLLNLIQNIRRQDLVNILVRLRGIQLFAESICSGRSSDELTNDAYGQKVDMSAGCLQYLLEHSQREVQYPDIQLWKRASDPILAHDAFSSLMWILFCLPAPFLSCEESYLSLVHVFYVVAITQAILTYFRKLQCSLAELGYQDCLITDIYEAMREVGISQQNFDSNYIEPSWGIKDAVCRLSFPYLRRCALLWKVIRSSNSVPFSGGGLMSSESSYSTGDDVNYICERVEELAELKKLEEMFKIPSLDLLINDDVVRAVVLRWLHHFSKEYEGRNFQCILHSNPVVPLGLMRLPYLYQDLLQRYIKQRCQDCGAVLEDPALCLLCGRLCSPRWKTCCRESGCQTHAATCGASTGIFLLIRKTTILLQRSARQALWPSPYLDAFGEEDIDMNRGKPLYLNDERYAALTHMVASHGLDRSSKALRQTAVGGLFML